MLQPRLELTKASVAIHIIEESETIALDKAEYGYTKETNSFSSFEKDLFSYKYEQKPPYTSYNFALKEIEIIFSSKVTFNSEGRQIELKSENNTTKKAKLFLNVTHFYGSRRNIWQMVFHPSTGYSWNEYEVIQLIKFFAGGNEIATRSVSFRINNEEFTNVEALLLVAAKPYISSPKSLIIQAGSLQVDTGHIKFNDKRSLKKTFWPSIYDCLYNSQFSDAENSLKLEKLYESNKYVKYVLNTFCGFVLGIFDFDRMEYEEVRDTIVPKRPTTNSFLIANKNTISLFCHNNDLFEEVLSDSIAIGISPYIIIPNSLLAYNDYWASESDDAIKSKSYIDFSIGEKRNIKNLITKNESYFIPNVFQYSTERLLYQTGIDYRGTKEKIDELKIFSTIVSNDIASYSEKQNRLYSLVSLFIAIISITQLYSFLKQIREEKIDLLSFCFLVGIISFFSFYTFISSRNFSNRHN